MYLNYKLKYRPEILHNDYRNSLLFQHSVIKKKIITQYWAQKSREYFFIVVMNFWPTQLIIQDTRPLGIYFQSSIELTQPLLHCQGSCLCGTVNNRGKVIYCYGDLVPRHGELFAEGAQGADGGTSSKDLLAAQLGVWTFGIFAL